MSKNPRWVGWKIKELINTVRVASVSIFLTIAIEWLEIFVCRGHSVKQSRVTRLETDPVSVICWVNTRDSCWGRSLFSLLAYWYWKDSWNVWLRFTRSVEDNNTAARERKTHLRLIWKEANYLNIHCLMWSKFEERSVDRACFCIQHGLVKESSFYDLRQAGCLSLLIFPRSHLPLSFFLFSFSSSSSSSLVIKNNPLFGDCRSVNRRMQPVTRLVALALTHFLLVGSRSTK